MTENFYVFAFCRHSEPSFLKSVPHSQNDILLWHLMMLLLSFDSKDAFVSTHINIHEHRYLVFYVYKKRCKEEKLKTFSFKYIESHVEHHEISLGDIDCMCVCVYIFSMLLYVYYICFNIMIID